MPNTYPVQTLFKTFQVFNVLDDGDTFSGADGSQIMVYHSPEHCADEQIEELEDGRLPETGDIESICLRKLLNEAMEAKLECVKPLLKLIGGK
jgi:hypothetical protein